MIDVLFCYDTQMVADFFWLTLLRDVDRDRIVVRLQEGWHTLIETCIKNLRGIRIVNFSDSLEISL